jgi:predicted aspartyl protease
VGTFTVELEVGDPRGERWERIEALVDTAASYTVVPAPLLRQLGVEPHTSDRFRMADGRVNEEEIGRTWVRLNGVSEITLIVFGSEDATPLLGAYTMEGLRLAPDPVWQASRPR